MTFVRGPGGPGPRIAVRDRSAQHHFVLQRARDSVARNSKLGYSATKRFPCHILLSTNAKLSESAEAAKATQ